MSTKTEQQPDRTALYEVLDDFDTAMLTTFTADGTPHGRPMHVAQRDGDTLWFVTGVASGKVREIASGDPAVLTFQSSDTWVAATGEVEISHDRSKVDELWSPVMKAWFPEGPEDPRYALSGQRCAMGICKSWVYLLTPGFCCYSARRNYTRGGPNSGNHHREPN